MDPLDEYMASIDSDITRQEAPSSSDAATHTPATHPPASIHDAATTRFKNAASHHQAPSPVQLAIAAKVAASPFCDVMRKRRFGCLRFGADVDRDGNINQEGGENDDMESFCLRLLLEHSAEFLR